MDGNRRHLRLVPYSSEDYSLGQVLMPSHGSVLSDPTQVSAAMSLYFQWEQYRSAVILVKDASGVSHYPCELDYDREERDASEIKLTFTEKSRTRTFKDEETILIRFEVFRICYEMKVEIMASSEDEGDDFDIIVCPPSQLVVLKGRRVPRVAVTESDRAKLPPLFFVDESNNSESELVPIELGMSAIRVSSLSVINAKKGKIKVSSKYFNVDVVRVEGEHLILKMNFSDGKESGNFFDYYRLVAFPALRHKSEFSNDELMSLYERTNYFGKFSTNTGLVERKLEITSVWDGVKSGTHDSTADYVVVNEKGDVTGASSIVRAFEHSGIPIWVFHQLCAMTNPYLLEQSGQLYTWRAEYLASRPGNAKVCGWFDGKSRWLERIYVKFISGKSGDSWLKPVKIVRVNFDDGRHDINASKIAIGSFNRTLVDTDIVYGGADPKFLNASGILDSVIALDELARHVDIVEAGEMLNHAAGRRQGVLEVTLKIGSALSFDNQDEVTDCDRMFMFEKDDLFDFVSSVEHSLAITLRKSKLKDGI